MDLFKRQKVSGREREREKLKQTPSWAQRVGTPNWPGAPRQSIFLKGKSCHIFFPKLIFLTLEGEEEPWWPKVGYQTPSGAKKVSMHKGGIVLETELKKGKMPQPSMTRGRVSKPSWVRRVIYLRGYWCGQSEP